MRFQRFIAVAVLLVIFSLTPAQGAESAEDTSNAWIPFAPGPAGEYGGLLNIEYDRRWLGDNLVVIQRTNFRLGGSPLPLAAFWIESGAASMKLTTGIRDFTGDSGLLLGMGWTVAPPDIAYKGFKPFISGRAMQFQTFVVRDEISSGILRIIHSRYVWQEVNGWIGTYRKFGKVTLQGAIVLRAMFQDEFRSTRTAGANDKRQYVYSSGVKSGFMGGLSFPVYHRFSVMFTGEIFIHAQRITVSLSQWGKP